MATSAHAISPCIDRSQPQPHQRPFSTWPHGMLTQSPSPPLHPPSTDRSLLNFPLAHVKLDTPSPLNLSNSVSPINIRPIDSNKGRTSNSLHPNISSLSPPASWDIGGTSLTRSISADGANPDHTPSRLYSGLGGHSSRQLERSTLDTLRQKAEALYRDQQAVIDEMSEEWLKEQTETSHLIHSLRERIQCLEHENSVLKNIASHSTHVPGLLSPRNSLQSGSGEPRESNSSSPAANKSPPPTMSRKSGRSASETSAAFSLPPGLDSASRRPRLFAISSGSAGTSPTGAPAPGYHAPLGPRTEPQRSSSTDFLQSSSPEPTGDVPTIDVHEIDPKLEGIPIKVTAVQRHTFEPAPVDQGKKSSPSTVPETSPMAPRPVNPQSPNMNSMSWRQKLRSDLRRSGLAPLAPSKDQTKQILATDECRRLTMHAGHTPNHSLSLFPTMTATESSSAAAQSQETTPTAWASSAFADQHEDTDLSDDSDGRTRRSNGADSSSPDDPPDVGPDDDIQAYLEPSDDVPLKGPLMIKNIPAQDEIFWAQVNKKLDPISRGQDALPKVLRSPTAEAVDAGGAVEPPQSEDDEGASKDSIGIVDSDDEDESDGKAVVEPDVPLKLRSTSNFGAPFGSA